jgi:hypothetical protein
MKKRKPLLALMTFTFHDISAGLVYALMLALLAGVAAQLLDSPMLLIYFPFLAVGAAPYIVLMKSEGTPTWDKYVIAVPIKRKELASSLYLNVFAASLLGIPLVALVWALGYALNGSAPVLLSSGFTNVANVYGLVFFMTAILYPAGSSRWGQRSTQAVFFGSIFFSSGIVFGLSVLGNNLGLSDIALSVMIVGTSGIAFIISLFITRAMFAKMDC